MAFWRNMFKKPKAKEPQLGANVIRDRDPELSWETLNKLGDGAFAVVYRAKHKTEDNKFSALKLMEDMKSIEESEMMLVMLEIEILSRCKHEFVLGLDEAYIHHDKLYMYLELCSGGGLDSIMQELQKGLTELQIRVVANQVCHALRYLHRMMVIHRDIKAANILLTSDGTTRLADFGVSALNNSYEQRRHTFIGTPYWTAPEVFECADFPENDYDNRADIWSLGITLIELAEIEPPHHSTRPERLFPKVVKGPPPKLSKTTGVRWHKDFHDILEKCLQKDPEKRPSADELLEHPFIQSSTDVKPLKDLLAEINAEVFDEEMEDDTKSEEDESFDPSSNRLSKIDSFDEPPEEIVIPVPSNTDVRPISPIQENDVPTSANKSEPTTRESKLDKDSKTDTLTPETKVSQIDTNQTSKDEFIESYEIIANSEADQTGKPEDAEPEVAKDETPEEHPPSSETDLKISNYIDENSLIEALKTEPSQTEQNILDAFNELSEVDTDPTIADIRIIDTHSPKAEIPCKPVESDTPMEPISEPITTPESIATPEKIIAPSLSSPTPSNEKPTSSTEFTPSKPKTPEAKSPETPKKSPTESQPKSPGTPKESPPKSPGTPKESPKESLLESLGAPREPESPKSPAPPKEIVPKSPETPKESPKKLADALKEELSVLPETKAVTRVYKLKGGDDEEASPNKQEEELDRQKKYKSIRRTRRFVIDGKVVTSTQNKFVTMDGKKDLAFEKLQKRREATRQYRRFQARKKDLLEKASGDISMKAQDFELKARASEALEARKFEEEKEKLSKRYKTDMAILEQKNEKEFQSAKTKLKSENDETLKRFKNRTKSSTKNNYKSEESRLARDVDNAEVRKERLKAYKLAQERENGEKERNYVQSLDEKFNQKMGELKENQMTDSLNLELEFVHKKHELNRSWNKSVNDSKERNIQQKFQLLKEANRGRFDLVRKLNLEEHDQLLLDLKIQHEKELEDIRNIHLQDNKQLPKEIKKENKTRLLMHEKKMEMMLDKKIISDLEAKQRTADFKKNDQKRKLDLIRKRERKQQNEINIITERQNMEILETIKYHDTENVRLDEAEKHKEKQTKVDSDKELEKFREERRVKEKAAEDSFLAEIEQLNKNYEVTAEEFSQNLQWKLQQSDSGSGDWSPSGIRVGSSVRSTSNSSIAGKTPLASSGASQSKFNFSDSPVEEEHLANGNS